MNGDRRKHALWLFSLTLLLMLLAMMIPAGGCASSTRTVAPAPLTQAGEGIAGIKGHAESADRAVKSARPFTGSTGKALLDVASAEHGAITAKADQAGTAIESARKDAARASADLEAEKEANEDLRSKWYSVWGRRIETALWVVGIGWLALGLASVFLGIGNPLSGAGRVGKEIVRLLPFANPFSWIRDKINRNQEVEKEQAIQTAVAKVVAKPKVVRPIPAVIVAQEPEAPEEDDLSARA